ncbi:MAG: biopolymer transporter ExbD [Chromatiales bacterium]|nr:biopolymer transporter ExbD [Chromatiales bacterium]
MNLRSSTRDEPEINLTSLIDVVLLLLVFFMITTSFVRESHIALRLPEASESRQPPGAAEVLEISVGADGSYRVNGRALIDARPETLRAAIRLVSADELPGPVTISADARAPHQAVVTAMDVAGRLGHVEIRIATTDVRDDD